MCLNPLYYSLAFESLSLADFEAVLTVDQIVGPDLFFHPTGTGDNVRDAVLGASTGIASVSVSSTMDLPPSPLTSFVRAAPSLSGGVLTAFDATYVDPTFHTNWDIEVDADSVVAAAAVLAGSLLRLALDDSSSHQNVEVDITLASALLSCLGGNGGIKACAVDHVESEVASLGAPEVVWGSGRRSFYTGVLAPTSGLPIATRKGASYSK